MASFDEKLGSVSVNFIDFGDGDSVPMENVYDIPEGLEMLAPAAAEVILARELPIENAKEVLEDLLVEVNVL